MSKKFKEYSRLNLPEVNKEMLRKWDAEDVFGQSIAEREGSPSFVFYEGPPSANGMPGIHHVMARTLKDIVCRYKTMKGYQVMRKAGWDTHGLPVELGVEKALGITKEDIGKKISVDDYNRACRREVMKYTREWEELTHRMGYWVDMTEPYITYDNRYIETVWWLVAQLYKKGYLYKGYTIQPYSPAAGTGLSTHELNQPGCYRDVKDTTCIAQFAVTTPTEPMTGWGKPYFLAWTTTPWTLPSNTALCVGPRIDYNIVRTYNPYSGKPITVVVAAALMSQIFNPKAADLKLDDYKASDKLVPYEVVATLKGADLVGLEYEQLLPWFRPDEGAFRVIPGDSVTTEDGTGIVHIAPTFGADDAKVAKAAGVPAMLLRDRDGNERPMVDMRGRFYRIDDLDPRYVAERCDTALYGKYAGRYVKNAYDDSLAPDADTLDVDLCIDMKQSDKVFRIEKHVHSYPHCWRTDKPVIYYPLDSWFIRTTAARDRLIALNDTINWKPQSTGTGRFGKWLENLQDWNLSRSRYWGTPLPIWRTEDGSKELCIESVEQLYAEMEKAVAAGVMTENPYKAKGFVPGEYTKENYERIDLHRPYVDDIVLVSDDGRPMRRELDLLDVWFDSGSMPYAQIHYPFENAEVFDAGRVFPADFIAEGVDQTRGWFFTLHAIAGMIFDSVAYRSVISNGLVLDKNGNKMSKRHGNAVEPFKAIDDHGSDPLRWYMISNSAPWDNLKFDEEGVEEVKRKFFGTLYNTYSFFALYANVDDFDNSAPQVPLAERPEIDRWIISLLNTLVKDVDEALADYEPTRAARAIQDFVGDNLSNWYVRLNRKRFWGGEMTTDKLSAYQTLYTCLRTVAVLMAPVAPFFADQLYRDLTVAVGEEERSVHLVEYPKADESVINKPLESQMAVAQRLTSMVLSLRRKVNIKVRQPLSELMVPVGSEAQRAEIEAVKQLVLGEVNVKNLRFVGNDEGVLVKRIKPDFKKLGPKHGKQMKAVAAALTALDQKSIIHFETSGSCTLALPDGSTAVVDVADVEIINEDIPGWLVANDGNLTVALDITVTDALRREGVAREIVNRVQNIRKEKEFNITDRIILRIEPSPVTDAAVAEYADYIARQVLADRVEVADITGNPDKIVLDIDADEVAVTVDKVQ